MRALLPKISSLVGTTVLLLLFGCGFNDSSENNLSESESESDKSDFQDDDLGKSVQQAYATVRQRHTDYVNRFGDLMSGSNRSVQEKIKLSVLNYNLGLLHVAGGLVGVPYYTERAAALTVNLDHMFTQGMSPDVIFFQELWYDVDRTRIMTWAEKNGYLVALKNNASAKWHGLNILVRKSILSANEDLSDCTFIKMGSAEIGRSTNRGLLSCYARLSGNSVLSLNTTHLTFGFGDKENISREEKLAEIAEQLNTRASLSDYIIFGGDFNLSPEFSGAKPEEAAGWAKNRQGYVKFVDATEGIGLIDTYIVTNNDFGYTQDRYKNSLTKESSSTKSEPEQRLDYVWAGTPFKTHGVMVHQSQLSFTWIAFKADMKSLTVPFSDHFGVVTDLTLYKSVR